MSKGRSGNLGHTPVWVFANQLAFVQLYNRLPLQQPLELVDDVLTYASVQLNIPASANRMRNLKEERRYAVLVCLLRQDYQDTIDHMVDMHDNLMQRVHNRAQEDIDTEMRKQRRMIRGSLQSFSRLGDIILDDTVPDAALRQALFDVDCSRGKRCMPWHDKWLMANRAG